MCEHEKKGGEIGLTDLFQKNPLPQIKGRPVPLVRLEHHWGDEHARPDDLRDRDQHGVGGEDRGVPDGAAGGAVRDPRGERGAAEGVAAARGRPL